jgi:anti-sigma B factor antagonist
MEIRKEWLLGAPLLIVVGDVDHSTAWELDNTIQQSRQGDDSRLFVDLTGCDYIDSGGLAVFLSLAGKVRSDGFLGVIGAGRNIQRVFDIVGLTKEPGIRMFADQEQAAAGIG